MLASVQFVKGASDLGTSDLPVCGVEGVLSQQHSGFVQKCFPSILEHTRSLLKEIVLLFSF